jgi:acyl dehydratase
MMRERYLDDFAVGQIFGSGRLVIDKERIKSFAAEFDPQPFHLDENAAEGSTESICSIRDHFAWAIGIRNR